MPSRETGGGRKPNNRSRITNGAKFLPGVHSQSVWARAVRDTEDALLAHCGGADQVSEPRRMMIRHNAFQHIELLHIAAKVGVMREQGKEPDAELIDLYGRLKNSLGRGLDQLGFDRVARDVSDLSEFIEAHAGEARAPATGAASTAPTTPRAPAGADFEVTELEERDAGSVELEPSAER